MVRGYHTERRLNSLLVSGQLLGIDRSCMETYCTWIRRIRKVKYLVLHQVMFALFLTLLLAEISWTAGKYLILESFLLQYRWISGEYLPPRALDATLSQEFVSFWHVVFSTLTDTHLKGNNFLIIKKTTPWWYWLMSIVDCHLLSISSIGYPGLLEINVCGTT